MGKNGIVLATHKRPKTTRDPTWPSVGAAPVKSHTASGSDLAMLLGGKMYRKSHGFSLGFTGFNIGF